MEQCMRPTDPNLRSSKVATHTPGMLRVAEMENGPGQALWALSWDRGLRSQSIS